MRYWRRQGQPRWMAPRGLAALAAAPSTPPKDCLLAAFCFVLWVACMFLSRRAVLQVTVEAISVPFQGNVLCSSVAHVDRPSRFDQPVTVTLQDSRYGTSYSDRDRRERSSHRWGASRRRRAEGSGR